MTIKIERVPYLTEYWGFPMGRISGLDEAKTISEDFAEYLVEQFLLQAKNEGWKFIDTNLSIENTIFAEALVCHGFYPVQGFIQLDATTDRGWVPTGMNNPMISIRRIKESDFSWIKEAYSLVDFPNHFVDDGGFNKTKAMMLYVRRYREVYEKRLGEVFVADIEDRPAGALIAIVDKEKNTNLMSGLGIIVHPWAQRQRVAQTLIAYRQGWYQRQGVKRVSFGVSIANRKIINCMAQMGFKIGVSTLTFHKWIKEKQYGHQRTIHKDV